MNIPVSRDLLTVDGKDIFALLNIQSRLCQRRSEIRVPVQTSVNLLQPVPVVFNAEVSAKKSSAYSQGHSHPVAAAHPVVPYGKLATHPLYHPVKVASAGDVSQEL